MKSVIIYDTDGTKLIHVKDRGNGEYTAVYHPSISRDLKTAIYTDKNERVNLYPTKGKAK